jgi:hypothetical protein
MPDQDRRLGLRLDDTFVYCSGGRLWNRCRTRAGEYLLKAARYGQALGRLSTPIDAHNSAKHYGCDEGDEHSNIHALKMKAHKTEFPHSLSFALANTTPTDVYWETL